MLTESRFAASATRTHVTPYARRARRVDSRALAARVDGTPDLTGVTLGGGSALASDDSRWTAEGANETIWNAGGRRHRFKASLWARADGLRSRGQREPARHVRVQLGRRLRRRIVRRASRARSRSPSVRAACGTPRRRSRISGRRRASSAALRRARRGRRIHERARRRIRRSSRRSASRPGSRRCRCTSARASGSRISTIATATTASGSSTEPSRHASIATRTASFAAASASSATCCVRRLLADASAATGLLGGTSVLSCVGSAVPAPDWSRFVADPAAIPTQCVDGSGVLAERAPSVTLIDPRYDVPRSWRASLDWNTSLHNWTTRVGGLASYDLSQPGTVDANFAGVSRSSRSPTKAIVRCSSRRRRSIRRAAPCRPTESRASSQFGRVGMRVSDLRGYGEQLTFVLAPDPFKFRLPAQLYASAGYTLQSTRRAVPRLRRRGVRRSASDRMGAESESTRGTCVDSHRRLLDAEDRNGHAVLAHPVRLAVHADRAGRREWRRPRRRSRVHSRSGARDRRRRSRPQLASLMASGQAPRASACSRTSGRSCSATAAAVRGRSRSTCSGVRRFPRRFVARVTPNVYLQNVLAGVDQLMHGSNNLRGWGSPVAPDPVLLVPRGFDAASKRFRYDVNARFADTRPANTRAARPVPSRDRLLAQSLDRLRSPAAAPRGRAGEGPGGLDSPQRRFARGVLPLEHVGHSQSAPGRVGLAVPERRRRSCGCAAPTRSTRRACGRCTSRSANSCRRGTAGRGRRSWTACQPTQKAYWKIFWEQPEIADSIITPVQRELIPLMKNLLSVPKENREHSQFIFGRPVTLVDTPPRRP